MTPLAKPGAPLKNYRVTIERNDGTFYVRDEMAEGPTAAKRLTMAACADKYGPPDGFSWWVRRCVEIKR